MAKARAHQRCLACTAERSGALLGLAPVCMLLPTLAHAHACPRLPMPTLAHAHACPCACPRLPTLAHAHAHLHGCVGVHKHAHATHLHVCQSTD